MINNSNCIIAQSGGPTAAINASLSGAIGEALKNEKIDKVYGALNGIQGLIDKNIIELNEVFNKEENLENLKYTPAMFLGSCRYKLDTSNKNLFDKIFSIFDELNIKYFFYIGGNDSMDTVMKLSQYAKDIKYDISIVGIPKTIDNDLFGTDHTPGFGSAAKFVSTTMLEIAYDTYIYNIPSITIVEIMGRNAGWLTASTALSRCDGNPAPDLIYLPEHSFSTFNFLKDIRKLFKTKKNIIIAVSEGLKDEKGQYISSLDNSADTFGNTCLSGTGKALEALVKTAFGCKVRSIELNILQRSAMHHASQTDLDESCLLGEKAVDFATKGLTGEMVTINRISNNPYKIEVRHHNINEIANIEKTVPLDYINEKGNDVTEKMLDYLKPLVQGQPNIPYKNGLPNYLNIRQIV